VTSSGLALCDENVVMGQKRECQAHRRRCWCTAGVPQEADPGRAGRVWSERAAADIERGGVVRHTIGTMVCDAVFSTAVSGASSTMSWRRSATYRAVNPTAYRGGQSSTKSGACCCAKFGSG
jgi:hypothetical protein